MKTTVYKSIGEWYQAVVIEYSSSVETDCAQADKFISRMIGDNKYTVMKDEEESEGQEEVD